MTANSDLLGHVRIAEPCTANWDTMPGDERARYCAQCRLNVYNLSGMSRDEAEALVREKEGRLCVRFYRRRDGTILTDNCPVGLRRARRCLAMRLSWVGALLGVSAVAGTLARYAAPAVQTEPFQKVRHSKLAEYEPFRTVFEKVDPTPAVPGRIAFIPPSVLQPPKR
jgi:hypothetical protein